MLRPAVEFLSTKGSSLYTETQLKVTRLFVSRDTRALFIQYGIINYQPQRDLTASFHASSLPGFQGNILDWKWSQYFLLVILFANIAALRAGVE